MPEPEFRSDFYNQLSLLERTLIIVPVNMQSRHKVMIEREQWVGLDRLFLLVGSLRQTVERDKYNGPPMRGKGSSGVHFESPVELLQSIVPSVFMKCPTVMREYPPLRPAYRLGPTPSPPPECRGAHLPFPRTFPA
jgi:hypothetical protein